MSWGRPREVGVEALGAAVVERQHVVAGRFDQEQAVELGELLGLLLRQVVGLRPIIRRVELPDVGVDWWVLGEEPRDAVASDSGPTLVVDAAVDEHLEVLGLAVLGCCW